MAFHVTGDLQTDSGGESGTRAIHAHKEARQRARSRRARTLREGNRGGSPFGAALLDLLPNALLAVDGTGRVLEANAAAVRLFSELDGLVCSNARIEARTHRENEMLLAAIARIVEADGEAGTEFLKISRPSGLAPYTVAVAPLLGSGGHGLMGAVVFVHDPSTPRVPTARQLIRLHGLTPTEAAVARELASGRSLKEIASGRDVCLNTVRGHLKGAFAKTGTHRQAELVAGILSVPPFIAFESV